MLQKNKTEHIANTFRFLGDTTRIKILSVLFQARAEMCVNEIADAVGATHSATSHQLGKLEAYDVVECFRRGQTMCYQIKNNSHAARLRKLVAVMRV